MSLKTSWIRAQQFLNNFSTAGRNPIGFFCCSTVPGKSKLTVPRYSNASTRSSILETQKLRVLSLELRTSSFETRMSSFQSRTSSFDTRDKELSASLIFHATYRRKDLRETISSPLPPSLNGDGCRCSLAHCQSDYTKSRNIQVSSSLSCSQFPYRTQKCCKRSYSIVHQRQQFA